MNTHEESLRLANSRRLMGLKGKRTNKLWKSMAAGLNSGMGNHKWKIGKWYSVDGHLSICGNGFHASERVIDAMRYVNMEVLAQVEVKGRHKSQSDKQCWSQMRVIRAWEWTKIDSVELAVFAALLVIDNYENRYPDDDHPRKAIEAAARYAKNPTTNSLSAASAAESAARSAASTARSAAESAEALDKIELFIQKRIPYLTEISGNGRR